jgi:hypothetical protein
MTKLTKSAKEAFDAAFTEATENYATCGPVVMDKGEVAEHVASLEAAIEKLLARSSRNTEAARAAGRYKAEANRFKEYI